VVATKGSSSKSYQGDPSLTEDPGSSFAAVWSAVVSELNGEISPDGSATNGEPVRPTTDTAATSMAEPCPTTDDRRRVCSAVGAEQLRAERDRTSPPHPDHRGAESATRPQIELGVRISPLATDESDDGYRGPGSMNQSPTSTRSMKTAKPSPAQHQNWPTYFTERPHSTAADAARTSLNRPLHI